jgi:hypothetical protein
MARGKETERTGVLVVVGKNNIAQQIEIYDRMIVGF